MKKLLLTLALLGLPLAAGAATASIVLDTGLESINALEGTFTLPLGARIDEIYTGDSMVIFWIVSPKIGSSGQSVSFAGLTPGGFRGKRQVFAISGKWQEGDLAGAKFGNVIALRNDGEGSKASVKLQVVSSEIKSDSIPPEPFTLLVSASSDLFGGKPFVVFAAEDKQSGVAGYEVAESLLWPRASDFATATSPYEVKDRSLFKAVYIKAIDKGGNVRESSVGLPRRRPMEALLAIILLVPCIAALRSRASRF